MVLGVNIFFPFSVSGSGGFPEMMFALGMLILKLALAAIMLALLESTIPKLRYFRLPVLLFTSFMLGLIALTMVII